MAVLNTLTYAKYLVPNNADPATKRRNKLVEKIDEQILLATDDTYTPTKRISTTNTDGNTRTIEKSKRVERWWCNAPRVSAHLMTLTPGVHWVPHSPKTDAAVRYCRTGSIARPHGGHEPATRTGAARCIPPSGIGRSAPSAHSALACRA